MSTVTASLPAEVQGKASAGQAQEFGPHDFVMLPIARKWGEHRPMPQRLIAYATFLTIIGCSILVVTTLVR